MVTIRLEVSEEEARHIAGALQVAADANEGNENTAPDGRSWEEFTTGVARRFLEGAREVGLLLGEEFSIDGPIPAGPVASTDDPAVDSE